MQDDLVIPDQKWMKDALASDHSSFRLFTSESYHRSFWMLARHGVVLIDKEYKVIEANPYFVNLIGLAGAELIGRDIRDFIASEFVRTDTIVMNSLINGLDGSYYRTEEIIKQDKSRSPVPVKIIVTRVPAQLLDPFQHFIVQVYKNEEAAHVNEQLSIKNKKIEQGWSDIMKALFLQPWFAKTFLWIIIIIVVLTAISGNLLPFLDKLIN